MYKLFSLFTCLVLSFYTTANDHPLYIGLDADLTAVAKTGGIAIQRGAMLAIDEINAAGGVLNRPLELISKDHRGNPARGLRNLDQFAEHRDVLAVLSGVHTPVVIQELDAIHKHELLFLVPWAAGTPIIDNNFDPSFVFRVSVRDDEAGKTLIAHANQRKAQRLALVLERTPWGRSNEVALKREASKYGMQITGIHWVNWGTKNVDKIIKNIEYEAPDAIVYVLYAPEGVVITRAIHNSPPLRNLPVITHWGIIGGEFVDAIGVEILNDLDFSTIQTFSFENAKNPALANAVLDRYRNKFDKNATSTSIEGVVGFAQAYDLVHLLAKATINAQSSRPRDIRIEMEQLDEHAGLLKTYVRPFSPDRHDALLSDDYFMATFNDKGELVPR